jgi:AI-2 transport protein TqsA
MSTNKSITTNYPVFSLLASLVIIIAGVLYAQSFINPMLLAIFLSIVCAQPIIWMKKRKVPSSLAILIVLSGIVVIFMGFADIIGASVSSFSTDAPIYEQRLEQIWLKAIHFFNERGIEITGDKLTEIIAPGKVMGYTAGALGQLGGVMSNTFTIFFLMLFLLMELDSFSIKTRAIAENTNVSVGYLNTIGKSIRHYLSIKTVTSLLTGLIIWVGLLIVGIDYAIIWALIAFLLNYIPNIGSIIAAFPAVLFALIQLGAGGAFWTIVVFLSVNLIVGNLVEPKMMGKGLGLSTFVVFVALIFWGFVLGTVGMFLSVPLTMSIKIMLEQKDSTRWIAVFLGTDEDAKSMLSGGKEGREN